MIIIGLCVILVLVLVLPFVFKPIEHNLEAFLFVMGVAAALVSGQMSWGLGQHALTEPLPITAAVLVFGLIFKKSRRLLDRAIKRALKHVSARVFVFFLIFLLGALSSIITAMIAALILVEVISMLGLDKRYETRLVVIACFSIGLGAALTPIGEPLSTIVIGKLRSLPDVNFWYLVRLLGWEVLAGIVAFSVLSLFFRGTATTHGLKGEHREESYPDVLMRAGKVYLFVMALVFLGQGFKPVIDRYVIQLHGDILYWINTISAVLDNATLAAAEISPSMAQLQIKKLLMGLLIAGGMLIPGNIPNIIAASKLKIGSREWAKLGVPFGFAVMLVFFLVLKLE